jgi:hypothetical protein
MKNKLLLIMIIAVFVISNSSLFCHEFIVYGKVINSETKEAVIAATVKVMESSKGTYTNNKGIFKINLIADAYKFTISSIGYKKAKTEITSDYKGDTLLIKLVPSEIVSKEALVIGNIEPKDIIKRAIEKKNENKTRLKTLEALIYSKLYADIAGSMGASIFSDSKSTNLVVGTDKDENKPTTFLMETFAKHYEDREKDINYTSILQRRQTGNIEPSTNVLAFTNFLNFLDEEIIFMDAHLPTPLSNSALDYYDFYLDSKELSDDKYIYNLSLLPKSAISPGFEGTISIIEGTYELINLNLKPTSSTAIQFVDSLQFIQKYSNISKNIWYPTYLEVSGKAGIDIFKGVYDVQLTLKAVSIINEIEINQKLQDSVYFNKAKGSVNVEPMADSVKKDFWDKYALTDLSAQEKSVYQRVDSVMSKIKKDTLEGAPVKIKLDPYIGFNRVGSICFGLSPNIYFFGLPLKGNMYYSIGQKDYFGDFDISFKGNSQNKMLLYFSFDGFSKIATMSADRSFSPTINMIVGAILHNDYYDYYKKDGWSLSLGSKYFNIFDFKFTYENSRQNPLNKTTDRTIFSKSPLRDNPLAKYGNYSYSSFDIILGKENSYNIEGKFNYYLNTKVFYSELVGGTGIFKGIESSLDIFVPLIQTGYKPIGFDIMAVGGYSDDKLPPQYQYRMKTSLEILSKYGNFYTAEPSEFGGMRYFEVHAQLDLTDYFYRVMGLPLYEGRGVNFTLYASTAKYYLSMKEIIYKSTEKDFYTEVGFGLSKIPTFISNIFYLEFQARCGIGNLAGGRFGWAIGVKLPF